MKYLYIDTSSSFLYTAIVDNNKVISSKTEDFGQDLSKVALPNITKMFEEIKLSPKDVDKIIVVNGPGSFTGIRIGITIAKVFAWTLNKPITTISSLEAMAISSNNNLIHIPILNARRGYVYTAIYDQDYNELFSPKHIKLVDFKKELAKYSQYEFISNDEFDEDLELEPYMPNYAKIVNKFKDKENINPHAVNPNYLKLTEAEESKL